MRTTRTPRERLSDRLLSLVLLSFCAAPDGVIGDRLKAAKLLFLATHRSFAAQVKGLNFSFYRYTHGPFTTELYETWGELNWMGFLDISSGIEGQLRLTDEGFWAAEKYKPFLRGPNQRILEGFKAVGDSYAQLDTTELLRHVYKMAVTPVGWQKQVTIGQTPMNVFFTCALEPEEAMEALSLGDKVFEDFFNELPRTTRPASVTSNGYRGLRAPISRGIKEGRARFPGKRIRLRVRLNEVRRKCSRKNVAARR